LAEPHHVVVDGSNLATEGRTLPSLAQLDEAVRAYAEEDPNSRITVVVDASFEHRIDESERETLREAMLNGEVVSPPAGAIGRGDAFVLRIAERTGAIVLSNDSFQEFHGQHPWLFDEGRLIGGKPVPGVGWIFTPRLPIRGPKSRAATAETRAARDPESAPAKAAELARAAKRAAKRSTKTAAPVVEMTWPITPTEPPPPPPSRRGARRPAPVDDPELSSAISEAVAEAIDPPTEEKVAKVPSKKKAAAAKKDATSKKAAAKKAGDKAVTPKKGAAKKGAAKKAPDKKAADKKAPEKKAAAAKAAPEMKQAPAKRSTAKKLPADLVPADQSEPRRRTATPPPAVNAPLSFINFVATYPVGTTVEGEVVSFTSHGAMVDVALPDGGSLHCYIPLSAMGDPPPTKARQVLTKGTVRPFVLSSLDPPRRVAELSLPEPPVKKRRGPAKKAAGAAR
jgi:Zc3h12a-like Ribonuclease NYN domain